MMIPCKLYVWCMILFTIVDVWYIFCQLFWWLIKINTMINNTVWIHTKNYKYELHCSILYEVKTFRGEIMNLLLFISKYYYNINTSIRSIHFYDSINLNIELWYVLYFLYFVTHAIEVLRLKNYFNFIF